MQPSDEIKQKLDIVDVIREYMPIKPAGMNFRARCPFHQEKTPSFMVSPDKQIWHCFGCGKGGDMFSFVQEIEGVNFIESLRILAPKAGITLQRQDPKLTSQRNRILDILEYSRKYYHKVLRESKIALPARQYLVDRGLSEETIEEWQVGFAPDEWESTSKFLKQKGFKENELFLAGMVAKSNTSSRFYDRFRGRIMFPINDVNSNTVAFSARVSPDKEKTEKMGKYINSPQTQVYNKSSVLFGLDKAKMEIKKQDYAIIVEGQMDVITAHQAGYKNVVASSGTALTSDQIQILKRYSENIILAFDMDEAGNLAADRGIREAMQQEINIKVIELPSGVDPDDCIRKSPEVWRQAVIDAKPMMQYFFDKTFKSLNMDEVADRQKGAKALLPIIIQLGSKIEQDFWLQQLSGQINIDENILRETINNAKIPQQRPRESAPVSNENKTITKTREEKMSELLLALLFKFPFLFEYSLNNIQNDQVIGQGVNSLYRNLLFYYNNIINISTTVEIKDLEYNDFRQWLAENKNENNSSEYDQLKLLDRLVFLGERDFFELEKEQAKNEIIKIIHFLKKSQLIKRRLEIERQISEAEKTQNKAQINELMEEFKILSDELREFND